jgi:hypothetical protein
MSTLTTRILGYKVSIVPATQEEIKSHRSTCMANGWARADYSRAVVARFVSEDDNVMSLPFELRSTIMTVNPEVVLDVMTQHVKELWERASYNTFCECFRAADLCDNCKIETAMFSREKMKLRGNGWQSKYDKVRFK